MLRLIVVFILFLSVSSCQDENDTILVNNINNQWKKNDIKTFEKKNV